MSRNIFFGLITSSIFFIINNRGLIDGPPPTIFNFVISILFVIIWYCYSYIKGKYKQKNFITFSTIFWGIGCMISIPIFTADSLIWISLIFLAPLNGFRFLFSFYGIPFSLFSTLVPWCISIIGYLVGLKSSPRNKIRQEVGLHDL